MASADYLCCSKCGCKIIYTPEDIHPSVYCPDCLEAEFSKVDRYWKALKRIVEKSWTQNALVHELANIASEALKDA